MEINKKEALEYFNLTEDNIRQDLERAYENKNEDPISREYYNLLFNNYRVKRINEVIEDCLKDVDLDKLTVSNLPKKCADFYIENEVMHSSVKCLLTTIKANIELLTIDLTEASSIDKIDEGMYTFYNNLQNDFDFFQESILSYCNCEDKIRGLIQSKPVISIKDLLVKVYSIINGLEFEPTKKIEETTFKDSKEHVKKEMLKGYVNIVMSIYPKGTDEHKKAIRLWGEMRKETDFNKFCDMYKENMQELEQQSNQKKR